MRAWGRGRWSRRRFSSASLLQVISQHQTRPPPPRTSTHPSLGKMLHCSCMRQPNQTICLQNKKYAQLGLASMRIRCKRDSSLKARVRMWVRNWAHESGAVLTSIYIYIHKLLHVGLPDQSNDPHSCRDRKCSSTVSNITEIFWCFNFANH